MLLRAPDARQDSRGEVMRLIDTFQIAAEESTRMYGAECLGLFYGAVHSRVALPRSSQRGVTPVIFDAVIVTCEKKRRDCKSAKQIPRYQEKSDELGGCGAGEWAPMDNTERNKGFSAVVRKFPVGAVSMVSPFNFPCAPPLPGLQLARPSRPGRRACNARVPRSGMLCHTSPACAAGLRHASQGAQESRLRDLVVIWRVLRL